MIKLNSDFIKLAEVARSFTGSTMSDSEIYYKYVSVKPNVKKRIYDKVSKIARKCDVALDEPQPMFVVYINILAVEEKLDPAILFLLYLK
ncbi:hypothetical protein U732_2315 [Clostridium argentinense CDC 2741]|uniref:Uncharacterized protein n=1 Tax=Clostridium argentinense CDC 2741 TaxID=1418104 RepID=A0A0C1QXR4_9CLOT|nr:hypothetical protein [Clostridium argentinense]ARC83398.1 hypothetical protein RSJ17_02005 [Clostridium argentinense]KIE45787.1 hypothetical protein U732_2315 [Clostridium argentinense CDC 2741]NFF39156.1 hypothetical protein [Clostridium argentinense]NFP49568.1 hypothetical protein [Clostridium argentinense]NFP72271.1 hypothetical protein [Clostridium argentinense]